MNPLMLYTRCVYFSGESLGLSSDSQRGDLRKLRTMGQDCSRQGHQGSEGGQWRRDEEGMDTVEVGRI